MNRHGRIFTYRSHAAICNSSMQKAGTSEGFRVFTEEKPAERKDNSKGQCHPRVKTKT